MSTQEDTMTAQVTERPTAKHGKGDTQEPQESATGPAETKTEKPKRVHLDTPYAMTAHLNARLAELGIVDPKTGETKKVGSPAIYIALRAERFTASKSTDGTNRWVVDMDSFLKYEDEYIAGLQKRIAKANGETVEDSDEAADAEDEGAEEDDLEVDETDEDAEDDDEADDDDEDELEAE
jgi:hypothetical protein